MPTERQEPSARHRAIVMDSFAWIEYFNGTSAGERVQGFLEKGTTITPTIVVAELDEKHRRLKRELGSTYDFVRARTTIIPFVQQLARAAGQLNYSGHRRR